MKKITIINLFVVIAFVLGSCGSSNNVVSNKLISKRKYTKGFHIKKKGNFKSGKDKVASEDFKNGKTEKSENNYRSAQLTKKVDRKVEKQSTPRGSESETNPVEELYAENTSSRDELGTNSDSDPTNENSLEALLEVNEQSSEIESSADQNAKARTSSSNSSAPSGIGMLILYIILCLIIPPLAVGLYDGIGTMFWLTLLFFLLGWGLIWVGGWAGLFALAAVVLAFLVVFDIV